MLADARALIPEAAGKFIRLYNATDLDRIRALGKAPFSPPAHPYIVSVGRLEESQKDFTTLLRAYAALVRGTGLRERLVLVGDGASRGRLEALARELGISERVSFAGFQPNPYAWIHHARLMAFSSKMEGLPNVLLEGMALGQFVVSTDCPVGPSEILAEGKAGLLTPVGDVPALAEAIRRGLGGRAAACPAAGLCGGPYRADGLWPDLGSFRRLRRRSAGRPWCGGGSPYRGCSWPLLAAAGTTA
ncbi:glycosyltransferase [Cupriavidus basilensis]